MTERARRRCLLQRIRKFRRVTHVHGTEPITDVDDVKTLVDELDLAATAAPETLAVRLSELRGHPIKILPYPEPIIAESRRTEEPLPYGVWIADPSADYVFYRPETTPSHRRHIILHELGHIWCRHAGEQIEPIKTRNGGPDHASVARAVQRAGGFAEDQEQAAEAFAYLIERRTRPNLSATGDTPAARYRLLED
ncbi:hypothetical protein [Amycolatopsis sp. MtRt-6]|uniref:hypothetical protein n=1 Tax=Amycolatopsis sp. MtRt-6 TaxID=2792782 RepID=UPI001A8E58B4|nr:hypothetical protein [Amycolatopsis sp. MtRt-6]